jgi:Na+-translocating ferredoxin:NAD+ oxidoreductase subunit B
VREVVFIVLGICAVGLVFGVPFVRWLTRTPAPPNPLATAVLDVLPGGNCGACGSKSCFEAASAVARGAAPSSICAAGGQATSAAVSAVLRSRTMKQVS